MPHGRSTAPPSSPTSHRYPRGALFILAGYLLERLVYYGLFGGAVFYMQRVLRFSAPQSTTIKSVLESLIYLAPILGAIIADTFLGKFRLVFFMCCGYVVGTVVFSLSSATPLMSSVTLTQATGIGGLLMFGLCAGLMKAVYSSLGPDQFIMPEQRTLQQRYFYFFYWMINAGAFSGQLLTAQLRDTIQCFGADCFLLPFGILVGLMVLSTGVFYAGKRHYREAPPDPMLLRAIRCVGRAIKLRFVRNDAALSKPVEHWLDRAALPGPEAVTDHTLIQDIKKTLGVLLLFMTFPVFWALFYQTSTGMIFQAKRLSDRVGSYRIPPELTSSINPLFILILIPLFDLVVYPLLNKVNLLTSSTSRIAVGMLFAVASFVMYGAVNVQVEQVILGAGEATVQVYNTRPCPVTVHPWHGSDDVWVVPPGGQITELISLTNATNGQLLMHPRLTGTCGVNEEQLQVVTVRLAEKHHTTVIVDTYSVTSMDPTLDYIKDKDADAKVRMTSLVDAHLTSVEEFILNYHEMNISLVLTHGISGFKQIQPQPFKIIHVKTNNVIGNVDLRQDGVYDIVFSPITNVTTFWVTAPSNVHVLWTIPQYLFMTIGEVLFSVSGMDFAYTESPNAMKSVMQAANLFMITIGLWILALLTTISSATEVFLHRPSREAFTYSALMLIDTMIFLVLVRRYYAKIKSDKQRDSDAEKVVEEKTLHGTANPAYVEEQL